MTINELKKGDKVIIHTLRNDDIGIVDRVTQTQVIVNGVKYRKENGRKINCGPWDIGYLEICTEQEEKRILREKRREKMLNYIYSFTFSDLKDAELEQVYSTLIDSKEKEK